MIHIIDDFLIRSIQMIIDNQFLQIKGCRKNQGIDNKGILDFPLHRATFAIIYNTYYNF